MESCCLNLYDTWDKLLISEIYLTFVTGNTISADLWHDRVPRSSSLWDPICKRYCWLSGLWAVSPNTVNKMHAALCLSLSLLCLLNEHNSVFIYAYFCEALFPVVCVFKFCLLYHVKICWSCTCWSCLDV